MERTLVVVKPDGLQRGLIGEIIHRFERKGLKPVGFKMLQLTDEMLNEHYAHHADKPFFDSLKTSMKASPVVSMVLEGLEAIEAVRILCGTTKGRAAEGGSIRGDFSMSMQYNLIHASDSVESAEKEIANFFKEEELFDYDRFLFEHIYAPDELK